MKTKKLTKNLWSWQSFPLLGFLVFSLLLAVTIVSCTKNFDSVSPISNTENYSGNGTLGINYSASSTFSSIFGSVGESLVDDATGDAFGWVLGSVGVSGFDPNQIEQQLLGEVAAELEVIDQDLKDIIAELDVIEQELAQLNCSSIMSELDDDISHVRSLINDTYNPIVTLAADSMPTDSSIIVNFVDLVLNGNGTEKGIEDILSDFETVLWNRSDGGIIKLCLDPSIITPPGEGFATDTLYYSQVSTLTDYYYGYYTMALLLYVEATHLNIWQTADSLGLLDSTYTPSNITTICAIEQSDIQYLCTQADDVMNDTYKSLQIFLTDGGAPYTDRYKIMQYDDSDNAILWTQSLEKYDSAVGGNCDWPIIYSDDYSSVLYGIYSDSLTETTYANLDGWEFAGYDDLKGLIDVDSAATFSTVGAYLESLGFGYLVNTDKVIQAYNKVKKGYMYFKAGDIYKSANEIEVIPFFYTDLPVISNYHKDENTAVFYNSYDFTWLLHPEYTDESSTGEGGLYLLWNVYFAENTSIPSVGNGFAKDQWFRGSGYLVYIGGGGDFEWADSTLKKKSTDYLPGWSEQRQKDKGDIKALMWPIYRMANITCTNGRSPYNISGEVLTMCGDDLDAWLEKMLPPPPSLTR